ncbi:uncharacterized protein LOC122017181 [Zingiber officinale]|uniref:uncharacterized protein LOC122017181 n=1 Tax=Zingiber officinale TaxID=94328 RepID=UPI001C4BAF05|nr:uncharacterized protein LOC122017181 [Zingiber officinale]
MKEGEENFYTYIRSTKQFKGKRSTREKGRGDLLYAKFEKGFIPYRKGLRTRFIRVHKIVSGQKRTFKIGLSNLARRIWFVNHEELSDFVIILPSASLAGADCRSAGDHFFMMSGRKKMRNDGGKQKKKKKKKKKIIKETTAGKRKKRR